MVWRGQLGRAQFDVHVLLAQRFVSNFNFKYILCMRLIISMTQLLSYGILDTKMGFNDYHLPTN